MTFILYLVLAAFALVLGFFALLKQKTYLDAQTGAVTTEIEVPFVGKLKTNAPALAFVIVGLAFGYLANQEKANEAKETWTTTIPITIEGQLKSQQNVPDWSSTEINVVPSSLTGQQVGPAGKYRIVVEVPKWQSFDDWLGAISFQFGALSGRYSPGAKNNTSDINRKTTTYVNADVNMN